MDFYKAEAEPGNTVLRGSVELESPGDGYLTVETLITTGYIVCEIPKDSNLGLEPLLDAFSAVLECISSECLGHYKPGNFSYKAYTYLPEEDWSRTVKVELSSIFVPITVKHQLVLEDSSDKVKFVCTFSPRLISVEDSYLLAGFAAISGKKFVDELPSRWDP